MEAIECIKGRRSVRKFSSIPVPDTLLQQLVDTVRYAPTWKNTQTIGYRVITNREMLQHIAQNATLNFALNTKTISRCPALVAVCVQKGICGTNGDGSYATPMEDRWEMFDAGVAAQTFCLAAHGMGLGSVILGIFNGEEIARLISLPGDQYIACLIALGYPDHTPAAPARKTVDQLLHIIK